MLGAVKTEFAKFGEVLATHQEAARLGVVDDSASAGDPHPAIARRLRDVEALPEPEAMKLLGDGLGFDAPVSEVPEK